MPRFAVLAFFTGLALTLWLTAAARPASLD